MTALLDLPEDVILLVLSNLSPQSYLNFCLISKDVYQEYNYKSPYWRVQTAQKFRLPISPLLHADGQRWYWLYKKLMTETRLYTWGQGVKGNLGPARGLPIRGGPRIRRPPRLPVARVIHERMTSQWPTETHVPDCLGTIVDLQCGGWSTNVLTSDGEAYTLGILDSADGMNVGDIANDFTRLEYLSQSTSALRQISAGRRHVLAIDDNGEILTWDRINAKGYKVFARSARDFGGKPIRVVAGWNDSSAYIPETGIVYWQRIKNDQEDWMLDGVHVKEKTIPYTARRIQRSSEKDVVFEVLKHIVLEGYIVYITSESRVFACAIDTTDPDQITPESGPFEVRGYASEGRELKDIQGSFRSFAVFTASGDVLAGDIDHLRRCSIRPQNSGAGFTEEQLLASRPPDVPSLQNNGVIQLAFGDHHYHALHANGTITSYGRESQCCGSLGLGDVNAGSWFRGVTKLQTHGWRPDAVLVPSANINGRQIWFEPEKKDWLRWMQDHRMEADGNVSQSMYSEWVEQEGRHWADGPMTSHKAIPDWSSGVQEASQQGPQQLSLPTGQVRAHQSTRSAQSYDNLGAYFAISVAAAGWHSGALVLVDRTKAEDVLQKWVVSEPGPVVPGEFEASEEMHEEYAWLKQGTLPRIDGAGMTTDGEVQPWRDGMPSQQELGLTAEQ